MTEVEALRAAIDKLKGDDPEQTREITDNLLDILVGHWHNDPSIKEPLREFLRMTEEEYTRYVLNRPYDSIPVIYELKEKVNG